MVEDSFIRAIVVHHLQTLFKSENIGVTCIYCSYQGQKTQTVTNLIASLLKQLVQDSRVPSDNVKSLYERHRHRGTHPTLDGVIQALEKEIQTYAKFYIIVDALDECPETKGTRVQLLKALRSLSGSINLMVTSRHLSSIEQQFPEAQRIHIHANDDDMTKYIDNRLDDHPDFAKLRANIINKVVDKARGM